MDHVHQSFISAVKKRLKFHDIFKKFYGNFERNLKFLGLKSHALLFHKLVHIIQ